jgi:signal transduction histidine kinase
MILNFRNYWSWLKKKNSSNFRNNCNKKSIKLTGWIRFLLTRANRISAKVTDCFIRTWQWMVLNNVFHPFSLIQVFISFFLSCFLAYSDDEKTIEEIIQEAEEGVDTYIKSPPVKIIPKMRGYKTPSLLKMIKRKRKLRCKKCAGCLAVDCGKCNYCL